MDEDVGERGGGGAVCARHHMLENDNEKEMAPHPPPRARLWCALHPQGKRTPHKR